MHQDLKNKPTVTKVASEQDDAKATDLAPKNYLAKDLEDIHWLLEELP
jgi:hypothetical protein